MVDREESPSNRINPAVLVKLSMVDREPICLSEKDRKALQKISQYLTSSAEWSWLEKDNFDIHYFLADDDFEYRAKVYNNFLNTITLSIYGEEYNTTFLTYKKITQEYGL